MQSSSFLQTSRSAVAIAAALLLAALGAAGAQDQPGASVRVEGRVADRSGAPLPRVEIVAALPSGHAAASTLTNSHGEFAMALPVGRYLVRASLAGFEPIRDRILEVTERTPRFDLTLEIPAIEEQIIVTATRTEAPVSQIGSSATVLTGDELARAGYASVADALRRVAGLTLVQSGPPGQVTSLFQRGGESKYTKVLVDGIPVNEPGGSFNFASLSTTDIDRIEVVRGPQSALFGSDAIAGVIQIFTHRGTSEGLSPAPRVLVEGGSFGTFRWAAGIEGRSNRLDYSAAFSRSDTDGNTANASFNQETFAGNLGFRPSEKTELRAVFRSEAGRAGVPGQTAFQRPDPDEYHSFRNLAGSLTFNLKGALWFNQRFALTVSDSRQVSEDPSDSGTFTPQYQDLRAPYLSFDFPFRTLNQTRRERFGTQSDFFLPLGHQLTLGGDVERESGTIGDPDFEPLRAVRRNFGGYVQDQWAFRNRIFATAGVRVEHNESFGLFAAPRASLALHLRQPAKRGAWGLTKLRASWGMGIKEPTLLESYSKSPYFRGNPNLEAERSASWDAGIEQQFGEGDGVVEVGYFDGRFRDQIAYAVTNYTTFEGTFFNLGRTRARGLEASGRFKLLEGWEASGAYTFTASRIIESTSSFDPVLAAGRPLLRRPRHSGFLELLWKPGRWQLGATGVFVGERSDSDFAGLGLMRNRRYATLQLHAGYRVASGISFFAALHNTLDRRYMEALGYPALGRHFRLGLRLGS